MEDGFEGMDRCVCPKCGYDQFRREMIEVSYCRVWSDKDGYHDEVLKTDDDHDYLFKCQKCGNDCSGMTPENSFRIWKAMK